MENNHSQIYYMQSELMQILRSIAVMAILSLIGYYSFLDKSPNFFWLILGGLYFLISLVVIRRIKKAKLFYLLIFGLIVINAILVFDSSLYLIFVGEVSGSFSMIWSMLIGIFLTAFGFWSQFQVKRFQLIDALKHNTKSGRLDLRKGYWDFDRPLHFDSPNLENKKIKMFQRLSRLSPLVTALGFWLARSVDGKLQTIGFGICLYVFGCVIAWGSTKYLAIAFQLGAWEKEYDIIIGI